MQSKSQSRFVIQAFFELIFTQFNIPAFLLLFFQIKLHMNYYILFLLIILIFVSSDVYAMHLPLLDIALNLILEIVHVF